MQEEMSLCMMMRSSRTEPPDLQACVIKSTDDIIGTHLLSSILRIKPATSLSKSKALDILRRDRENLDQSREAYPRRDWSETRR
jgi:hypothetical protein